MKITIRLIALVIIGSLMSTGASAQNIPNADNEYEALMRWTVHSQMWITPVLNEPTGHQ